MQMCTSVPAVSLCRNACIWLPVRSRVHVNSLPFERNSLVTVRCHGPVLVEPGMVSYVGGTAQRGHFSLSGLLLSLTAVVVTSVVIAVAVEAVLAVTTAVAVVGDR